MKGSLGRLMAVIASVVIFFILVLSLQSYIKEETQTLAERLRHEGVINYKSLSRLDSENLSKTWRIYSRKITLRDLRLAEALLPSLIQENPRRKTVREKIEQEQPLPIHIVDFLGIVSYGLLQDMKVVCPALLISIILALSFPLVQISGLRLSSFIPVSISYIPPFLVIVLAFYFASSARMLIISLFGVICSTRLGILLSNSVKSLENDDYVIYMVLGGVSRPMVTLRYTYFELLDSIIWGILWTFYTLFSLKIAMDSLSLNVGFEVNTGSILMGLFAELPSTSSLMQFCFLAIMIACLFILLFTLASTVVSLYYSVLGFKQNRHVAESRRNTKGISRGSYRTFRKSSGKPDATTFSKIVIRDLGVYTQQDSEKPILMTDGRIEMVLGDKVFVKGPSGAGKTLLSNAIVGIVWDKKLMYEGRIEYHFAEKTFDIIGDKRARYNLLRSGLIDLVPQNPKFGFNQYSTVKKQIQDFNLMEPFENLLKEYFPNVYDRVMKSINLTPSKINDGALQIINFVLLVARMRDRQGVILFDEPIASLSRENVERVYKMLRETIWDDKHLIIWIGHELETLERLGFNKVFSVSERQNRTVATISEIDQEFLISYRRKVEKLIALLSHLIDAQAEFLRKETAEVKYEIKINNIEFRHQHIKPPPHIIVNSGDIVFIRGENGSGKTTMIKALIGYLQKEVKGEILWFDDGNTVLINKSSQNRLRKSYWKEIDVIFQNPDFSVPKYLRVNEKNLAGSGKCSRKLFEELLKKYNLVMCYDKRFYQLSYGQKKRVKLIRTILKRPSTIFLDEPTASLDVDNIELFINTLIDLIKANPKTSLFIVTHQDVFQKVLSKQVKIIEMKSYSKSWEAE